MKELPLGDLDSVLAVPDVAERARVLASKRLFEDGEDNAGDADETKTAEGSGDGVESYRQTAFYSLQLSLWKTSRGVLDTRSPSSRRGNQSTDCPNRLVSHARSKQATAVDCTTSFLMDARGQEALEHVTVSYDSHKTRQKAYQTILAHCNRIQDEIIKLADPTKLGTRKILAFILVDPTKTIL